jgi:hypothetical protein
VSKGLNADMNLACLKERINQAKKTVVKVKFFSKIPSMLHCSMGTPHAGLIEV